MRVMRSFDRETALTRVDERTFTGIVTPAWSVGRGANGGFVAALLPWSGAQGMKSVAWISNSL